MEKKKKRLNGLQIECCHSKAPFAPVPNPLETKYVSEYVMEKFKYQRVQKLIIKKHFLNWKTQLITFREKA